MKALFPALIVIFLLEGCFTVKSNEHFTYTKLTTEKYYAILKDSSNHYLIDVRTPGEFRKSHAPGAVNYNFLAFHFGRDIDSLNRDKTAFIYCHTCHRSPFAGKIMKRKGFTRVYDLKDGFSQWLKAGLPLDTGYLTR